MSTDETGEPWPYEHVDLTPEEPEEPHWTCPDGTCACNVKEGEAQKDEHEIVLFDGSAKRMSGARCRVLENGTLLNNDAPYADGSGAVRVRVRPSSKHLQVEWAPKDTPPHEHYPYRKSYYLDLGTTQEQGVERRLHNIGYSFYPTLEENIKDFQRAYSQPQTGKTKDVAVQLAAFHDEGALPPKSDKATPDPELTGAPGQTTTKKSLVGDEDPAGAPPGGGSAPVGKQKKGSAADDIEIRVRVRVRTRACRMIQGAKVTVDAGGEKIEPQTTGLDGFANFTVLEKHFGITSPRTFLTIEVEHEHHGEDPGPFGTVKPGALRFSAAVGTKQLKPQTEQPLIVTGTEDRFSDREARPIWRTLGVVDDPKRPRFLDVVLMDVGMNIKSTFPSTKTRKLTDDEVQREFIYHYVADQLQLDKDNEPQFEPDTTTGGRKVKKPLVTARVAIAASSKMGPSGERVMARHAPTVWDVTYFSLGNDAVVDNGRATDEHEGERFTRDQFQWIDAPVSGIDQRLAVGICRLSHDVHLFHDIKAMYHIGFLGHENTNTHMHGLAWDFGGCAKALPEKPAANTTTRIRLGVDFHVFFHWGRVPMWDGKTVAAHPDDASQWKRVSAISAIGKKPKTVSFDDGTHFPNEDPKVKKNHYRLDPPPFKNVPVTTSDADLAAKLAKVEPHFAEASKIFLFVYEFSVREFSDQHPPTNQDPGLGPNAFEVDPPTPIDDREGHLVIHPDYGERGLRGQHNNHIHAQFGPTSHPRARS